VDARAELRHPPPERVLALVEPVHVGALPRELLLAVLVRDVAAHRNPVARVLGEEVEPLLEAARVQELGLAVEEVLDLPLEQEASERGSLGAHGAIRPVQLSASMNWRQRP
jgi:hypothetical protein